jgi:dTDP-glucose 4,6-dehydratase
MNILVTGGAGFIGSNFVEMLSSHQLTLKPSKVTVLDNFTYAASTSTASILRKNQGVEFVKGDIRDETVVNQLTKNCDLIFHFAAESHVDRSIDGPQIFASTNVLGTTNLLHFARNNEVEKFIHVSTDEVYGSIESGSSKEDDNLEPNSPYAASKAASDLMARAFAKTYGLAVITTRCTNNYGPFQNPEKAIPLFITNLLQGKSIPIYGDGSNIRDWLHVSDHCRALDLIASFGNNGEIYNIGGGTAKTNLELAAAILGIMNESSEKIHFVEDRKGHDKRYSVNFDKAKKEIGYAPSVDFYVGLEETIAWYQKNQSWWKDLIRN